MDGYSYSNLTAPPPPSPPPPASGGGCRAARPPAMELTNTKETKAWEGLAIGAVTLARTFSSSRGSNSHRFCRSGSESRARRKRSRSGLPGALRRAFSMRRHPAGGGLGGAAGDGYWRIHDMDGDSDRGDGDDTVVEEHGEDDEADAEEEEKESRKTTTEQRGGHGDAGANAVVTGKEGAAECRNMKEKKLRGGILKACKKLFRL